MNFFSVGPTVLDAGAGGTAVAAALPLYGARGGSPIGICSNPVTLVVALV